ncbi:conserved hypothetical protein [uncultured Mycobacterium sp.]|uniref:Uncharacterized protein n=1 Tax=uncultured Mycobacterium sp. TaxID=171292 RepID=A0A1Y5P8R2_9MYCO|nr:conserved hypothetical protein [uncultured Mycobacterium sp.]
MPTNEKRPAGNGADSTTTGCTQYIAGLHRRRAASWRTEPLHSGHRDPWRYDDPEPTERMVDGYRDAVEHLGILGLTAAPRIPEMRVLWRRGGDDQRLVRMLAERWEVAA